LYCNGHQKIDDEELLRVSDSEFWLVSRGENLVRVEVVGNEERKSHLSALSINCIAANLTGTGAHVTAATAAAAAVTTAVNGGSPTLSSMGAMTLPPDILQRMMAMNGATQVVAGVGGIGHPNGGALLPSPPSTLQNHSSVTAVPASIAMQAISPAIAAFNMNTAPMMAMSHVSIPLPSLPSLPPPPSTSDNQTTTENSTVDGEVGSTAVGTVVGEGRMESEQQPQVMSSSSNRTSMVGILATPQPLVALSSTGGGSSGVNGAGVTHPGTPMNVADQWAAHQQHLQYYGHQMYGHTIPTYMYQHHQQPPQPPPQQHASMHHHQHQSIGGHIAAPVGNGNGTMRMPMSHHQVASSTAANQQSLPYASSSSPHIHSYY
jgi:hypothetical protein